MKKYIVPISILTFIAIGGMIVAKKNSRVSTEYFDLDKQDARLKGVKK